MMRHNAILPFRPSAILRQFHDRVITLLPDKIYFALIPPVLLLLDRQRRGTQVSFKSISKDLACADDPDFGRIFFYEPSRFYLYQNSNGIQQRFENLLKKYEHGKTVIEKGDVVFDIGANIGEFSLAAERKASKVYAFEPDEVAFRCLTSNSTGRRINCYSFALSNKSGHEIFFLASGGADSSLVEPLGSYARTRVECRPLDDVVGQLGIDEIDFLKVEAEGWEPEVLLGGERTLRHAVRKVAVDAGPERRGESTSQEVAEILRAAGFAVDEIGDMVYGAK